MKTDISGFLEADATCKCDNCGHRCKASKLKAIEDIEQRLSPGDPTPAGECPKCGALSFLVKHPWDDNELQFARLIAETQAVGGFTKNVMHQLSGEMDLTIYRVNQLLDRAQKHWEDTKSRL